MMKAPKLRGPFRNVRTEPRTFKFKSRHLPDERPEWEERKRRVEARQLEGRRLGLLRGEQLGLDERLPEPVSYTHLTLPTILLV